MQQCARQRRPLDEPATERARRITRPGEQLDLVEGIARHLPHIRQAVQPGHELEVFLQGEVVVQHRAMRQQSDGRPASRIGGPHRQAVEQHLSSRGPQQSGQDPQQRRLPDAVWSGHGDRLAFLERQAHASEHHALAKAAAKAGGLKEDRRVAWRAVTDHGGETNREPSASLLHVLTSSRLHVFTS